LRIAAPWRVVTRSEIVLGWEDHGQQFGLPVVVDAMERLRTLLEGRQITSAAVSSCGDLSIHFAGDSALEIFNASSGYEGWHLDWPGQQWIVAQGGGNVVEQLPDGEPTPDAELVRVLVTGDAGLIPLAKSLLQGEQIEYLIRGEGLQDLFGWGRMGAGYNYVVGPAEFWVRADDVERARALLEGLGGPPDDSRQFSDDEA
jgi:hypothetical protein